MAIKIENAASIKLPKTAEKDLEKMLASIQVEHLRGVDKVKLVDFISDPRLKNVQLPKGQDLPGLYHPKIGGKNAWFEISMGALLRPHDLQTQRGKARRRHQAQRRRQAGVSH